MASKSHYIITYNLQDFKYDTRFCHCAKESLEAFFQIVLGLEDGVLGLVMVIYTFGDYARFYPHLHVIVADGLFQPNGTFYVFSKQISMSWRTFFGLKFWQC